ncbi:MAG: type II toxin-antitoxin system MazE family antitoxin [Deinococcus sp.]
MTTFRGTVKDGQLVFPAEVTEQLGLHEGDAVDVPEALLSAARAQNASSPDASNPFVAWIGSLPPLPGGQDAVSLTRSLRDPDEPSF